MNLFITFEGGDGVGKSVQAKMLYKHLIRNRKNVILTREPGDTIFANEIRKIVLTGDPNKITPLTESLLYLSARSDHWINVIKPSLDLNKIVICDRFHDSSIVYQGMCRGVNISMLNIIYNEITNGIYPNRTYLIDIDPNIGVNRSLNRIDNKEVRFEKMGLDYHNNVRKSFLKLADDNKNRFKVIDGMLSISEIHSIIIDDIKQFISI